MATKKYQIFVSSTFRDLADERQDAIKNILDIKHISAGMELFPASDVNQLDYIKKVIDECDYYVLIMGGRYGSMDEQGVSFTEREYDYAVSTKKLVLAFVHKDPESLPVAKSDVNPEAMEALAAFRKKVMSGRLVKTWSTRQELEPLVLKSLIHAVNDHPQVGWIRGDSAATDAIIQQNNKILQENAKLKNEILELKEHFNFDTKNIAGLEENFKIKFRSKKRINGMRTFQEREVTLPWLSIFLGVAGQLGQARPDMYISLGVGIALKDLGFNEEFSQINELDKIRIKVQLLALGLIKTELVKSIDGVFSEYIILTDRGRAKFMDYMVMRKS